MSWINTINNKEVESTKYALNYELDDDEKKLLKLSKNHTCLIDWITKAFDKFGYAEKLKPVRKYYRMNYLQENDCNKISIILEWSPKSLGFKKRVKYFLASIFMAKDVKLIKSLLFYIFLIAFFVSIFNINEIKFLIGEPLKLSLFFLCLFPIISIGSLIINFILPIVVFYKKGIFFDIYGNKQKQEEIKQLALNTMMEISGVYQKIEVEQHDDKDFLANIELLSQKYQTNTIKKSKNLNPYINFCEDVYEQANNIPKINYSYEELLQKNKEKVIIENKQFLEKTFSKEKKNKHIKI